MPQRFVDVRRFCRQDSIQGGSSQQLITATHKEFQTMIRTKAIDEVIAYVLMKKYAHTRRNNQGAKKWPR